MPILAAHNVSKTYTLGKVKVPVLKGVSFSIEEGERVAILGRSGSGKSTLLHLLGGLDRPDVMASYVVPSAPPTKSMAKGAVGVSAPIDVSVPTNSVQESITFNGRELSTFSNAELDSYRNHSVGLVFQFYHLFPELPVIENVLISPMIGLGRIGYSRKKDELTDRAQKLLTRVGLGDRLNHRPSELSGGERQRVAIARALINQPPVVLADEPTGNLDQETGAHILDLLDEIQRESRQTMVIVTHDAATAARADRVVRLVDGKVFDENNTVSTSI